MTLMPTCWDFSDHEDPPVPVIPLIISNPQNPQIQDKEIFLKVDTGFNGAVGLLSKIINELQLQPWGKTDFSSATSDAKTTLYEIYVQHNSWKLNKSITYTLETKRALAGRILLAGKQWLMNFQDNKLCYLEQVE